MLGYIYCNARAFDSKNSDFLIDEYDENDEEIEGIDLTDDNEESITGLDFTGYQDEDFEYPTDC